MRRDILRLNPLCADCLAAGRATAAAEVHHIASLVRAPARRLDPTNLLALCKACHSRRTRRGE